MIAVIADDLSGAAEVANAAVDAGFSAEVQIQNFVPTDADVICVDTETRSLMPERAAEIAGAIARAMGAAGPALIYKKCDSVLRGPVAAESLAIARALGRTRVLLVPANPSRNRIIRGGEYFVDGGALDQTAFAADPEHPRQSSHVVELLGESRGIETPDTATSDDLKRHASTVDGETLPAGGVDFFNAVLDATHKRGGVNRRIAAAVPPAFGPSLFVCGSLAAWQAGRSDQCVRRGIPTFLMPAGFFEKELHEEVVARWAAEAAEGLRQLGTAIVAIGDRKPGAGLTSDDLARRLAEVVKRTLERATAACVFLEGGATALAVARRLGVERFEVGKSPGPGVGALRPVGRAGPLFLIKPGSYSWPEAVWRRE